MKTVFLIKEITNLPSWNYKEKSIGIYSTHKKAIAFTKKNKNIEYIIDEINIDENFLKKT